ncbi:hypothetical protein Rleg4DRAFT_2465 [Rhizobium leguminosarum bv. trifolii WSM2297]|uniref:Uncharacterized protein n=1 Tax=Rhizobium leguminosarum bv. trifolii WSM2297 TaxID=754762 RepID=J0KT71_RHILT|nr:hypothetical protein [Rhizobium leguminosarum]EJC80804.1 hypothetical protein Rleg4DRAFT_2465 [Rhizobium leguminosarum bv. trifolii WSM2297]
MSDSSGKTEELRELFGSFRAEWLRERLFSLFNEPEYFPSLRDRRPCVLMGGRGTGKTTVLRCMSYQGQAALSGIRNESPESAYIGLYHRVNSNRVTAFQGPELSDLEWRKLFAHYMNLLIAEMIFEYLDWFAVKRGTNIAVPPAACARIAKAFGVGKVSTREELAEEVATAKQALELYVNNLDGEPPQLSMLQAPIDDLTNELSKIDELDGPFFYILFDEYENFLDYQQIVVNTLIKHSSSNYVFKVGVRELGWRVRSTLNGTEQLIHPADYELIHIERRLGANFTQFARDVCEARLREWSSRTNSPHLSLDDLLLDLPYEKEAELLGVSDRVQEIRRRLQGEDDATVLRKVEDFPLYVFWSLENRSYDKTLKSVREYAAGSTHQKDRFSNYKYAMLFTIASNGAKVSKYYCGNRVFSTVSRFNIRFYLHLVSAAIDFHHARGRNLGQPISPTDQTLAAREVGLQYLTELEGVTVQGVQLVKLILGFGRLFQILSRNPQGKAPETMEFAIKKKGASGNTTESVRQLITNAVMHLALVRSEGTKLATEADIKEWDYSLHPIFAPYFNFSHRRKRKLDISEKEFLGMVEAPQETIKLLLKEKASLIDDEPPLQLQLFNEYYAGAK